MRRLFAVTAAIAMGSLFSLMFWSQVATVANALARPKPHFYAVTSSPYLPVQKLEPVY
jgi:hypothetical protein